MRYQLTLAIFLLAAFFLTLAACDLNDDDSSSESDVGDDDDDAVSDDDDNDDNDDEPLILPTTLDKTLIPVEQAGEKVITEGPGEPHISRNDLSVVPTKMHKDNKRLSMAYFTTVSDTHETDEESPTRLSFLHAWTVMFGSFESFFRPQEDLTPHMLCATARTINHLQTGYGRDFDLAFILGDGADNGQQNEIDQLIDVLDGAGILSGVPEVVRPDSGDLDIDPESGFNFGERDFGIQETDAEGNNTNPYTRPDYPESNADFYFGGLVKADQSPLPWYFTLGNHDVLANGGFDPDGNFSCHDRANYIGDHSSLGFIPGLGNAVDYMNDNRGQELFIGCGLFGMDINWQKMMWLFRLGGDWSGDIDPRFDLLELINNTPEDPTDDGVFITPDDNRMFLGSEGVMRALHEHGHGFSDNNSNGYIDWGDGGWYRIEWSEFGASVIPMRILVLNTTDLSISATGGIGTNQLAWLESELKTAVSDRVLVIVVSHHYGDQIVAGHVRLMQLLNGCPNVILHLVGHGHENAVTAHPQKNGDPLYGYWEVQTPSNRDFPQQSRIFEIVDNRDGTGSIYSTLYDYSLTEGDDPDTLAELGRELSVSEWEWGFDKRGEEKDRNVELLFTIPSEIADDLAQIQSNGLVTSIDSLGQLYGK